jgi:hypothetical protein
MYRKSTNQRASRKTEWRKEDKKNRHKVKGRPHTHPPQSLCLLRYGARA